MSRPRARDRLRGLIPDGVERDHRHVVIVGRRLERNHEVPAAPAGEVTENPTPRLSDRTRAAVPFDDVEPHIAQADRRAVINIPFDPESDRLPPFYDVPLDTQEVGLRLVGAALGAASNRNATAVTIPAIAWLARFRVDITISSVRTMGESGMKTT